MGAAAQDVGSAEDDVVARGARRRRCLLIDRKLGDRSAHAAEISAHGWVHVIMGQQRHAVLTDAAASRRSEAGTSAARAYTCSTIAKNSASETPDLDTMFIILAGRCRSLMVPSM